MNATTSRPVTVGTDGSDDALRAVDWAADEAVERGARLRVVHASRWAHYEGQLPSATSQRSAEEVLAQHYVASAEERARVRQPGLTVSGEVLADDPVTAFVAESDRCLAIVLGHRGRGELAGLLLGSVGLQVAARARCPVVVVRGHGAGGADELSEVVVGVGERGTGSAAVTFAFEEAAARGCAVTAIHAWRVPSHQMPTAHTGQLDDARQSCRADAEGWMEIALRAVSERHPEVKARQAVVEGGARRELLAVSRDASLLVVGARRRGGGAGLQLGPVNHALLHHAQCPVAVVPER
ncbi:universal stress protein [Streptomyces sp. ICBB 8177]|uniref:universal stress protein n=1 Tax=Streptomyces sp. ICBB 8177 TaxID=563922 RepID=UPI000D67A278|nr:universal stress protein [Streptomyces sp. ICBB 8177]PWI44736.1 universal stress protein [Streptomyces sp. ICBB 8177]